MRADNETPPPSLPFYLIVNLVRCALYFQVSHQFGAKFLN